MYGGVQNPCVIRSNAHHAKGLLLPILGFQLQGILKLWQRWGGGGISPHLYTPGAAQTCLVRRPVAVIFAVIYPNLHGKVRVDPLRNFIRRRLCAESFIVNNFLSSGINDHYRQVADEISAHHAVFRDSGSAKARIRIGIDDMVYIPVTASIVLILHRGYADAENRCQRADQSAYPYFTFHDQTLRQLVRQLSRRSGKRGSRF